jgi:hypothetical protein
MPCCSHSRGGRHRALKRLRPALRIALLGRRTTELAAHLERQRRERGPDRGTGRGGPGGNGVDRGVTPEGSGAGGVPRAGRGVASSGDPAVDEALRAHERMQEAENLSVRARDLRAERGDAERVLARLDEQDRTLNRASRDFRAVAEVVYRDPAKAVDATRMSRVAGQVAPSSALRRQGPRRPSMPHTLDPGVKALAVSPGPGEPQAAVSRSRGRTAARDRIFIGRCPFPVVATTPSVRAGAELSTARASTSRCLRSPEPRCRPAADRRRLGERQVPEDRREGPPLGGPARRRLSRTAGPGRRRRRGASQRGAPSRLCTRHGLRLGGESPLGSWS